jgi:glycogen(starch) synthase
MFLFISGRYEHRNKGIDLFIRVLGKINKKLQEEKSKRTIVVFFWVPQGTHGIKVELLENKTFYNHIKNYVNFNSDKILSNIVYDLFSQQDISKNHVLTKEFIRELKKNLLIFKRGGNPTICTHHINDEQNDPIIRGLMDNGLDNKREDRIKVVVNPVYLEGNDGLINLRYYDAVAGCHLGVFPSYYEPWGYTPMEAVALGVPAITSDLAGFGRFVDSKINHNDDDGIFVIKRFQKPLEETENEFLDLLARFSERDKYARANKDVNAKGIADLADWNLLVENYVKAHNLALERVNR